MAPTRRSALSLVGSIGILGLAGCLERDASGGSNHAGSSSPTIWDALLPAYAFQINDVTQLVADGLFEARAIEAHNIVIDDPANHEQTAVIEREDTNLVFFTGTFDAERLARELNTRTRREHYEITGNYRGRRIVEETATGRPTPSWAVGPETAIQFHERPNMQRVVDAYEGDEPSLPTEVAAFDRLAAYVTWTHAIRGQDYLPIGLQAEFDLEFALVGFHVVDSEQWHADVHAALEFNELDDRELLEAGVHEVLHDPIDVTYYDDIVVIEGRDHMGLPLH